ncbi:hypothetical protein Syun_018271 [Stephania yunnanensis]|uniref:Ycf49-like protein n=1 Tax=Stephania yunnanensis TaxID=152371 RepID=A0AAP0NW37_9MAGN
MEICAVHSPTIAVLRRPLSAHEPTLPKPFSKPLFSPQNLPISLQIPPFFRPIGPQMPPKDLILKNSNGVSQKVEFFMGFGLTVALAVSVEVIGCGGASAVDFALLSEPKNALSLPTWAIHVSSVVEWITAMVLVWQYGEKSGFQSWKGLSWGMVPLLGGAFCACTWHFFYNAESLSVLVALQAALTVIGNFTMCIAAFRIYKSTQEGTGKS